MKTPATWLLTLVLLLGAPVVAHAEAKPAPAAVTNAPPARRAASTAELDAYARRAQQAKDLEEYEGGRGGSVQVTTIIIVLLVVLLVVILV